MFPPTLFSRVQHEKKIFKVISSIIMPRVWCIKALTSVTLVQTFFRRISTGEPQCQSHGYPTSPLDWVEKGEEGERRIGGGKGEQLMDRGQVEREKREGGG